MTSHGRREWLLGLAGLAAGATGLGLYQYFRPADQPDLQHIRLPDLKGTPRSVSEWSGNPLLVNFWATWCTPCRQEVPALIRTQAKFGVNGLQIVGIAIDSADKVQEFARQFGINYPVLIAGWEGVELIKKLGNSSGVLPYTLLFDRQGERQWTHIGELTEEQLGQKLGALVAK